jgi:two-component system sensor histidine kinase BaeS
VVSAPGPGGHALRFAAALVVLLLIGGVARASRSFRRSGIVLDALVDQAARLESGDYAARVAATGREPRPVADLVRGFNTMAARLEANERQRRTLIADVTHELRTPLTVIAGNVEAILDGIHPADDAHLGAILEETRVLRRLVEDLRTLALSEAGSLSLHREPTDLEILCNDVATSFAAAAEAGRVTIEATVADDVPLLDVDPVRIREVLGNLVANALRHTPSGGSISIRATRAPGAGSGGGERDRTPQNAARAAGAAVEIVVQDTGSGIEPALLPHVFDRFARGAGSTGTGLGLSIARGLVELHGGSIAASSPPAGGTAITIRLPVGGR